MAHSVLVDRFHSLVWIELPQNIVGLSNHTLSLAHGAEIRRQGSVGAGIFIDPDDPLFHQRFIYIHVDSEPL